MEGRGCYVDGGHCAGDVARAGAARGLEHLARSLRHLLHALAAHHLENLRRGFVLQVDAQLVVARLLLAATGATPDVGRTVGERGAEGEAGDGRATEREDGGRAEEKEGECATGSEDRR